MHRGWVLGATPAFCHTLAEHLCESRVVCGIYYSSDIVAGEVVATAVVVTYTYKIVNLASCADRPDVQQAFPDIGATVGGASKTNQAAGLQLTSNGWEVSGR